MKKQVQAFIKSLGGSSSYAGNTEKWTDAGDKYAIARNKKTMFINDPGTTFDIETAVWGKFGELPFTLKTN